MSRHPRPAPCPDHGPSHRCSPRALRELKKALACRLVDVYVNCELNSRGRIQTRRSGHDGPAGLLLRRAALYRAEAAARPMRYAEINRLRSIGGNAHEVQMVCTCHRRSRAVGRRRSGGSSDEAQMGARLRDVRALPHPVGLGRAGDREAHQRTLSDRRLSGFPARQGDRHQPGPVPRFRRHDHLGFELCGPQLPADRRDLLSLRLPRREPSAGLHEERRLQGTRERAIPTRPATRFWP